MFVQSHGAGWREYNKNEGLRDGMDGGMREYAVRTEELEYQLIVYLRICLIVWVAVGRDEYGTPTSRAWTCTWFGAALRSLAITTLAIRRAKLSSGFAIE